MLARGALIALLLLSVSPQQEQRFPVHVESLEYPALGRSAHMQGDVTLAAWPDADGRVTGEPQVLSGNPVFAKVAARNLRNWRFQAGEPGEVKVSYHFRMDGEGMRGKAPTTCQFDLPDSVTVITRPPWAQTLYSMPKNGRPE